VRVITNIPYFTTWGISYIGESNDLWGLSAENFIGETNIDVCVYVVSVESYTEFYLDYLSADITYSTGDYQTNYFGYDDDGLFVVQDQTTNRYPLVELDTLSNQVAAIEGTDANSFIALSNQVDGLMEQTNTWNTGATDASAATGSIAILQGDFDAHISNETADIQHLTAAEKVIATNAVQQGADGTSTNLSDYNNDAGFVTNAPTNQIIDVSGVAYIITNTPSAAGDVLVFDPASTTAQFVAQSPGGITLAGATLAVDTLGGWGGYQTGGGSTTNNGIVVSAYSTANATNNFKSGWAFFSAATNVLQDKYAYARIPIPPYASGWGETAMVFRVRTSSDSIITNYVNLLLDDGSTAFSDGITNLVSTTAGEWLDVPVLASALPAAWTNDLDNIRPALSLRGDYFAWQSNYCQWVEVQCNFE